ncbi:unnamed protein product [Tetraodon nigroviridis]|uniref:(spotted green pufferfish) hypothetical protein n=1 Tax=Tetraodon nigroviridis TaxID=99883 RepID=Q4RF45_TETNG|nr:unnamed protein product [Tetraodon nigroviridis]
MDDNNLNVSNVKVAVRVRPMNRRGESHLHRWKGGKIVTGTPPPPSAWENTTLCVCVCVCVKIYKVTDMF